MRRALMGALLLGAWLTAPAAAQTPAPAAAQTFAPAAAQTPAPQTPAPTPAEEPGAAPAPADEPALGRAAPPVATTSAPTKRTGFWAPRDRGPRLKLGYRTFSVGEMSDRDDRYHMFGLDGYIYSGYVRTGLGLAAGWDSGPRDNFIIEGLANVGLQYPTGLTPFVDFSFGAGVVRREVLHTDLVDFAWSVGLDAGVELFAVPYLTVSAAIGWRRQAFQIEGNDQVATTTLYFDSFTVKVGFGF